MWHSSAEGLIRPFCGFHVDREGSVVLKGSDEAETSSSEAFVDGASKYGPVEDGIEGLHGVDY